MAVRQSIGRNEPDSEETKRVRRAGQTGHDREYQIVYNEAHDTWDIHRDDGVVPGHSWSRDGAIILAIRQAQQDKQDGIHGIVCVEQFDRGFELVWAG